MATNSIYKSYDGTEWIEYHFKTNAGQVGVTATRKFITTDTKVNGVSFVLDSSGNGATATIKGSDITSNVTAQSGKTLQYIANTDTIAVALSKLDAAAKAAYDNVPNGILTTSNYSTTLNSVYLGKTAKAADADKLDSHDSTYFATATGLSTHTGATNNPHSVTKSQVGLGSVVNAGMDNTPTSNSTNYVSSKGVYDAIQNVMEVAQGKAKTYVMSVTSNPKFNSQANDIEILESDNIIVWDVDEGDYITLDKSSLRQGDVILIFEVDVPDRWLSGYGQKYTFSKLETTKVDLSWNSITGKPTIPTVNNSTITVQLNGSNVDTFTTNASSNKSINIQVSKSTVGLGNVENTALSTWAGSVNLTTFGTNGTVRTFGSAASLDGVLTLSSTSTDTTVPTAKTVYNSIKNLANKVFVGSSTPTGTRAGDVWIDTSNS